MSSYVFEGPKWPAGPITWAFASTTFPVDQSLFAFSDPLSAAVQATVVQAVQRWASVSGLAFQQVADTSTVTNAPDIRIGFGDLNTAATNHVGETKVTFGQYFVRDIVVRLEDPAEFPLTSVSGSPEWGDAGGATLYQVALHELGHALGLGHSSDPADVMYPIATQQNTDLSPSDILGIRALYPPASIVLHGPHTDYIIADVSGGQVYIQDTTSGRDGIQTLHNPGRIVFSDGSGVFDPTGTAEDVTRLYQGAFGRVPDVGGLEFNTALVTTKSIGLQDLAASFAASPEFNSLYGQTDIAGFVQHLYLNILHRGGDAAGQQVWANYVNATDRGHALLAFSDSQENHQQSLPIAGSQDDAEVTRLYQAALGRAPDAASLGFIASRLQLGATIDQLAQGLIDSPEFAQRYGGLDTGGLLRQLYANVLHRAPDAAGEQSWATALAGGVSRAEVVAGFADSNENRVATAGATHDAWVYIRSA